MEKLTTIIGRQLHTFEWYIEIIIVLDQEISCIAKDQNRTRKCL